MVLGIDMNMIVNERNIVNIAESEKIERTEKNALNAPVTRAPKIYDNILQTIGNTPLVQLNRLKKHFALHANILGKIEYFNPAGSIKDRPAIAMIEALMASDEFTHETEIIDATSGNNGVSCAWICAYYNIPLTIVIPEHMSIERRKMIHHFGAKLVTTPKELGTKGAIDKAKALLLEHPKAVMLDQFGNHANPNQHASTTAKELLHDSQGKIDIFVAGVGTGGTITGVGQALKQYNPNIQVVAVEPSACPVLSKGTKGTHAIQGLSSGHIPDVLDQGIIDRIITVSDSDAIKHARLLAIKESLPVGISCGAAICAAMQLAAESENKDKNIVVILADTAERYYSTDLFEYAP